MAQMFLLWQGVTFGIKVSHSHRRSNRTWNPNVKRVNGDRGRFPEVYLRLHPLPALW